jgi:hypothetical protein
MVEPWITIDHNIRVRLAPSAGLSSDTDIQALTAAVWPPEVLATVSWRNIASAPPEHRFRLLDDDANLVAAAGVLLRQATLDSLPVNICGVCGVMTLPRLQGLGLGRIAMKAVQAFIQQQHVDFGLLFCESKSVRFYKSLGWRDFNGQVYMEQPTGRSPYNILHAMTYPNRTASPRSGLLDLLGYPW